MPPGGMEMLIVMCCLTIGCLVMCTKHRGLCYRVTESYTNFYTIYVGYTEQPCLPVILMSVASLVPGTWCLLIG